MSDYKAGRYVRKEIAPLDKLHLSAEQVPVTIDDAYRFLRKQIGDDPDYGAAWKLGGTTEVTRRIFDVEKLYFGPLHKSEVFTASCVAPGRSLFELKGEAEIALRIAPQAGDILAQGKVQIDNAKNTELFDAWCVALELPSSPIENLVEAGVNALVADRCASGALVLGSAHLFETSTDWLGAILRTEQNGEVIAEGRSDALVTTPDICARDFLVEALERGFSPKPGQWISTGGLTPCIAFENGATIGVFYNESQAFSFTAGDKAA